MNPQRVWTGVRGGFGLVLLLVLAGCQSTPRYFDGAVGYTFAEQEDRQIVTYTDEATHDWSELESRALAACASETGHSVSILRLAGLHRSEFVRNVPVTITYPAGVVATQTNAGAGGMAANVQEAPHTYIQSETVTRRLAFRRITATCQAG